MWNDSKELKEQLIMLEKLKVGIMKQINLNNGNEDAVIPTKIYPTAKVEPFQVNGYPVFRFAYDGMLPHYIEDVEYNKIMSDFYFHATISGFDFEDYEDYFEQGVFIVFCQYFSDSVIRDLDNRNKKYIQDAIRHSRIINDDDWERVSNINIGFTDDFNHTQVYVVEDDNVVDFLNEIMTNNEKYKCIDCIKNNKQSFLESAKKAGLEEEKNKENNSLFNAKIE